MSNVKCIFLNQGLVIGDILDSEDEYLVIKNPALIITKSKTEFLLVGMLGLVEEDYIKILKSSLPFINLFTPKNEILNHYNRNFGSGIEVYDPSALQF